MRGQAFVVFANIKSAQLALTEQTNYVIFDKPMIIDMACKKSDAITIMDGTYEYKDRKKISELCQQQKLKRQEKETKAKSRVQTDTNNVLRVENQPQNLTNYEAFIDKLFGQFKGYSDSKIISAKGIAFIEFEDDSQATIALKAQNGFKYSPEQALKVYFVKLNN